MSAPTGSSYPGSLDTGSSTIGTAVSPGQPIASDYANAQSAAILAIENALGTTPQGTDLNVGTALTARARNTDLQKQSFTYATDAGSGSAYVVTLSPVPTAYTSGMVVVFKATNASAAGPTLNVNSLGAVALTKNGTIPLAANDIAAGQIITAVYDGDTPTPHFQVTGGIGSGASTALTGSISMWGGSSAPSGYLLCDGSSYSTTTYAALYGVIGTTFGGSGSSFNVPDLRGKAPFGAVTTPGSYDTTHASNRGAFTTTVGGYGGESTHSLLATEMPPHTHTQTGYTITGGGSGNVSEASPNNWLTSTSTSTGPAGGSGGTVVAHNTIGPFVNLYFIIKT